jgi:undecaprenyl-diphosphatase
VDEGIAQQLRLHADMAACGGLAHSPPGDTAVLTTLTLAVTAAL